MAAGLGYIEFTTGDVLTAASANGYLASQVVMVFASAAARTSAIASPQEGMISYLKDTNATQYYSGSAWVSIGGGTSGPSFRAYRSSNQTISANTWTKVQLNNEDWDTDNCWDSSTNYRFTPTTAGKYQVNMTVITGGTFYGVVYKNGSENSRLYYQGSSGQDECGACMIDMNGTTDYIEFYIRGSDTAVQGGQAQCYASAAWIRS
jgi:hypothetical protein